MTVEDELIAYLDEVTPEGPQKARNIQIVTYFYGFDETPWPTLEATALRFAIGSRERVRQLVRDLFKGSAKRSDLPHLQAIAALVRSDTLWLASDFVAELARRFDEPGDLSLRGLLNLLHDVGLAETYEIYDHDLERVARASYREDDEYLIARSDAVSRLKPLLQRARVLPGQLGLAHTTYLRRQIPSDADRKRIKMMIQLDPNAWASSNCDDDEFWYAIESRENTLATLAAKVFATCEQVTVERLATALANGLKARSPKGGYAYPGVDEISSWIEASQQFSVRRRKVEWLGEAVALNPIETELVRYLKRRGASDFRTLKKHLSDRGFQDARISQSITRSSIVHVDRSGGRLAYRYVLVGESASPKHSGEEDRYGEFRKKLSRLEAIGTDAPSESKVRREQRLLKVWMLAGKDSERCALCGKSFMAQALVAAHKKLRAECSTSERLDPNIVMPLCVFGCDYLYENGFVCIESGRVCIVEGAPLGPVEKAAVKQLEGRRIEDRWLAGPASYFRKRRPIKGRQSGAGAMRRGSPGQLEPV